MKELQYNLKSSINANTTSTSWVGADTPTHRRLIGHMEYEIDLPEGCPIEFEQECMNIINIATRNTRLMLETYRKESLEVDGDWANKYEDPRYSENQYGEAEYD
jgi:hypothetical protein